MFAQESVMDIKKEREAFERLPLAELAIKSEFVFYNEETNSYWPNEDFCPSGAPETMSFAWEAWQAAKAHEAEKLKGCVLVPVQCPDPDFADSLFDELSKKAIGEFGDDLLIHFSDIDEEKIWALMLGAAKDEAVPEWISVEDKLPTENENYLVCIDGDVFYLTAKWVKNHFKFLARGYGLTEDFTDWRYCEGVKVTHWMTLPAAPQEPTND